MTNAPIRVLLADDHQLVRTGLATMIAGFSDLELVGQAGNGAEAVLLCTQCHPDVVLMDLVMPEMDGVAAMQVIHRTYPEIRLIALTSFKDEDLVSAALQAGAISYLLKDASVDELMAAIRAAYHGRPTLSWEAAQALITGQARARKAEPDLTDREREVLAQMAAGLTNRQIASQLDISPFTVNAHVSRILSKLGAASRTEAVAVAIQHGLIPG